MKEKTNLHNANISTAQAYCQVPITMVMQHSVHEFNVQWSKWAWRKLASALNGKHIT